MGVPRSVGQIYGLLFASPVPLTFTDIVATLAISKGSGSQGLQALRTLGAVRTVRVTREQREYFGPELGLRHLIGAVLSRKIGPLVTGNKARMEQMHLSAQAIAEQDGDNFFIQRVEQLETWRRQLKRLLPVVKTFLGPV